jgi:hypothetical protein
MVVRCILYHQYNKEYSKIIYIEENDAKKLNINDKITIIDLGDVIVKSINMYDDYITSCDFELFLDKDNQNIKNKISIIQDNY